MGLMDTAKEDWQTFTTDLDGFGKTIQLIAPDLTTLNVVGIATKHHIGIDTEGNMVNVKNAHVSFSEKQLTDAGYPHRDANGEVNMDHHKVVWTDSTGNSVTYVVREYYPDETIGVILCILGDII